MRKLLIEACHGWYLYSQAYAIRTVLYFVFTDRCHLSYGNVQPYYGRLPENPSKATVVA